MEAVSSSETLVSYRITAWRHKPEDFSSIADGMMLYGALFESLFTKVILLLDMHLLKSFVAWCCHRPWGSSSTEPIPNNVPKNCVDFLTYIYLDTSRNTI